MTFFSGLIAKHGIKKLVLIATVLVLAIASAIVIPIAVINSHEHAYDNACDTTCNECGEVREVVGHIPESDDGDCTTEIACTVCKATTTPAKNSHTGDTATCTEKAVCTVCSTAYGTVDANNHIDENTDHICDRNCGKTDIGTHVDSADDNDHVCDYGCGETLSDHVGGTSTCMHGKLCEICGYEYETAKDPTNHTSENRTYTDNNNGTHNYVCSDCGGEESESHIFGRSETCVCGATAPVSVTCGSITLYADVNSLNAAVSQFLASGETDITIILPSDGDERPESKDTMQYAIRSALRNSTVADGSVNLTIKGLNVMHASFLSTYEYWDGASENYVEEAAVTKVKSITLTDATEIDWGAFMDCTSLVSVSAPNASYIGLYVFAGCNSLETLSLTTEGEVVFGKINMTKTVFGDPCISEQVQLILHVNKQADVVENAFEGYTFKSVTYTCDDGTTMHSVGDAVAYVWNEDYTVCSAGYVCTKCSYVDLKETVQATLEAVTENSTAHSATFTNAAFETQTKTFGYIYDSATNTYSVWKEDGLNMWRLAVADNYATNLTLMDDITLSTDGITVDENGKPSASNWTFVYRFEGILDGKGHSIVNLRIYDEFEAFFIGIAIRATIKDLTLVNPVVYGEYTYTAGLVSQISFGTSLINCHVQGGSITGEMNGVGGLVGTVSYNTNYIYGCTNSAKVTGTGWVGGIVGSGGNSVSNSVIVSCANFGEISGDSSIGGIVGESYTVDALIGCYTTECNICGDTRATITDCYYLASEDTDGKDGTTAVADVNTAEVVNTMNAAIDTYNSTATVKCNYHWEIGADGNPTLVEITE